MDNDKPWNLIDAFLKKDYRLLNREEREYTKLLRNSYMSVYEVLEVTPGESMLVKNLIEDEAHIPETLPVLGCSLWTKFSRYFMDLFINKILQYCT